MAATAPARDPSVLGLLHDLGLAVLRRRRLALAAYGAILGTALAGVFLLPPTYRAAGKLLVTTNRAEISTSPARTTALQRTTQVSDVEMASQLEILRSTDLVEAVLDQLGPPLDPAAAVPSVAERILRAPATLLRLTYRRLHGLDDLPAAGPRYWDVRETLLRLETENLGSSSVVEVAFSDHDPVRARDFVNHLMDAYVERHAELQRIQEAEDFFTRQSELLRGKLSASEAELRGARERAGVLAGHQAEIHTRLNEFSAELVRVRVARAEQEKRVQFLEGLRAHGGRGAIASPGLLELEAQRAALVGRYRPDSQRMQALDAQIARLRAALAGYDVVAPDPATGAADPGVNLIAARATLAALRGKEDALEREKATYQSQAEFLDAQSFDLTRLERQVNLDEEAYLSYVRTAEESRLSNALEQSKLLRLRVIEQAQVPLQAASPNKVRVLAFALVGGLVLAVGLALLRDQLDPHVKTAGEVARATGLEVLAAVPPRA